MDKQNCLTPESTRPDGTTSDGTVSRKDTTDTSTLSGSGNKPDCEHRKEKVIMNKLNSITPENSVPDKTVPDKTVPDKTVPDKTMLDKTMLDKTMLDKTMLDKTMLDKTMPDKTMPDNSKTNLRKVNPDAPYRRFARGSFPNCRRVPINTTASSGNNDDEASWTLSDLLSRPKKERPITDYPFVKQSKDSIPEGWYDRISIDRIEKSVTNKGEPSCDVSFTLRDEDGKGYRMKLRYPLSDGALKDRLASILEEANVPWDMAGAKISGYEFSGYLEYNGSGFAEISLN